MSKFGYDEGMMKDLIKLSWYVFVVGSLLGAVYFFPWKDMSWGKVIMEPVRVVTVTGTAESKEKNQIATYNAGVNSVKDNKDEALKEVNDKISAITVAVKEFGIEQSDIQTQSMNVYQRQNTVWDNGVQKSNPGQWEVNNSISITLRNVDKASGLAGLLTKSGATNVYGPNFQLDTTKKAEDTLIGDAIENAKVKAEAIAKASGASLGKVVSVSEGYQSGGVYPMYARDGIGGGGGGIAVEPGSSMVSKSVTVVWEIK
jgi:uncharacterized protein